MNKKAHDFKSDLHVHTCSRSLMIFFEYIFTMSCVGDVNALKIAKAVISIRGNVKLLYCLYLKSVYKVRPATITNGYELPSGTVPNLRSWRQLMYHRSWETPSSFIYNSYVYMRKKDIRIDRIESHPMAIEECLKFMTALCYCSRRLFVYRSECEVVPDCITWLAHKSTIVPFHSICMMLYHLFFNVQVVYPLFSLHTNADICPTLLYALFLVVRWTLWLINTESVSDVCILRIFSYFT